MQFDARTDLAGVAPEDLAAVDAAPARLAEVDPRARRIVELRYFVGLTIEEIAEVTGTSVRTLNREWGTAKTWLRAELRVRKRRTA